jgi:hypothetical protein
MPALDHLYGPHQPARVETIIVGKTRQVSLDCSGNTSL